MADAAASQAPAPQNPIYQRNQAWVKPGADNYITQLPPQEEQAFQQWVAQNKVPFDPSPTADYDMRGFWKGLQTGDPHAVTGVNSVDKKMHFSDWWKTPYHESFSAESQWADPDKAPKWNSKNQLVSPDGKVVFDEHVEFAKRMMARQQHQKKMMDMMQKQGAAQ